MKLIAIIAGALAVLNFAGAQGRPSATVIGSSSGQFLISAHGTISPKYLDLVSPHSLDLAVAPNMLTLEPQLLAVSCDRIKAEVLRELNMPDLWRGKIFVRVVPARSANDLVFVAPQKLARAWHVGVELPDAIDQNRLVEAIVRATLMEIANRNATDQPTEVPEWLTRGLARQVMGSSAIKIVLRPPHLQKDGYYVTRQTLDFSDDPRPSVGPTRKMNPLAEAMDVLRSNDALTFDQLSWPTDEQLNGSGADLYGSCAQLFVSQLLRLKTGPDSLHTMLADLPAHLNWQIAFEDAFQGTFNTTLDVEKWWALEVTQFNGRDLLHLLTAAESSQQLDAVFQFPIEVQIGVGAPMRTDITLQTIIRGWNRDRQMQLFKSKIWELGVLRMRISPDFIPLLDQYLQVMQEYTKNKSASTRIFTGMGLISDNSADEAIAKLDSLDVQRANLRQRSRVPVVTAVETPRASP